MDPTKHNYLKKLMKLYEQGKIPSTSLTVVDIYHDDWCGVYQGEYCNCDPDIQLRPCRSVTGRTTATPRNQPVAQGALDEDTRRLQPLTTPCPHCGSKEFILWQAADDPKKRAISCNGCGAVMSSTHPLDPDDRPMRRP